jgi:hypothetical protein
MAGRAAWRPVGQASMTEERIVDQDVPEISVPSGGAGRGRRGAAVRLQRFSSLAGHESGQRDRDRDRDRECLVLRPVPQEARGEPAGRGAGWRGAGWRGAAQCLPPGDTGERWRWTAWRPDIAGDAQCDQVVRWHRRLRRPARLAAGRARYSPAPPHSGPRRPSGTAARPMVRNRIARPARIQFVMLVITWSIDATAST